MKSLDKILTFITLKLIKLYQITLSPDKGILSFWLKDKICCHEPHCSEYGVRVLKRYGFFNGIGKTMLRVSSCTGGMGKKYDPEYYKVVFFCSSPIGINYLNELKNDNRFDIVGVVTASDKPSGRGMEIKPNIIKQEAIKLGIDTNLIKIPERITSKSQEGIDFLSWLKGQNPDFLVVIAYGKILKLELLEIPNIAPINVHGSLLPKYRGASPIQSVFLNNETESGITIIKMNEGMDTGNMIDKLKCKLEFNWTAMDLINWITGKGPKFLNNTLWNYGKGLIGELTQNEKKASYCQKIEKENGLININEDKLSDVLMKYKGYYLWPKIYFIIKKNNKDIRIVVDNIEIDQKTYQENKNKLLFEGKNLNKCISKINLKPEGSKIMDWNSFVNGYLS